MLVLLQKENTGRFLFRKELEAISYSQKFTLGTSGGGWRAIRDIVSYVIDKCFTETLGLSVRGCGNYLKLYNTFVLK